MNKNLTRNGFTLIELLVVIAIIAILAAILFPVFASAREKARQSACLSNLKQIGLAVAQYEQDYDEYVPSGWNNWGYGSGWAAQLYPYVKAVNVFICPSETTANPYCSYGYSSNMVNYQSGTAACPTACSVPIPISQMTQPSQTVVIFEVENCTTTASCVSVQHDLNTCSPVGNGIDRISYMQGANAPSSSNPINSSATTLKYATGLLFGISPACTNTPTPCQYPLGDIAAITPNNSFYPVGGLGRHNSGAIYLMADNHARWLLPSQVSGGASPGYCPSSAASFNSFTAASATCLTKYNLTATFSYD